MVQSLYFDGKTAADRPVTVTLGALALRFEGETTAARDWLYDDLAAIETHHPGHPFRLTSNAEPDARLKGCPG